jgi:hypothetical protein
MRQLTKTRSLLLAVSAMAVTAVIALSVAPALAAEGACPNEQLRHESDTNLATGQPYSTELPECRAFELVSPPEKNGQHIEGTYSAPDGNAEILGSKTSLPGSPTGGTSIYVSRRASTGWATTALAPSDDSPDNVEALDLGEVGSDFSTIFLGDDNQLVPSDTDSHFLDLFAVGEDGSVAWASQGPTGGIGTAPLEEPAYEARFGGAPTNLSHVVFETTYGKLLPEDTHTYGSEIYDRINGTTTKLVGLLPDESIPECGVSLGEQSGEHTENENQRGGYLPTSVASNTAVSTEGTKIFFRSPDSGAVSCSSRTPPQLYVRIDNDYSLQVSAPAVGVSDPDGEQEAHYAFSTPGGNRVFFTSKEALTASANTSGDTTEDLYECEIIETAGKPTCGLTDLSSTGLTDPDGSQVQGVVDVSENGEVVYFVAKGKLTNQASNGELNLYVSDGGHLAYIAALSPNDVAAGTDTWSGDSDQRTARVTPDGSRLLFSSAASVAGNATSGFQELYLYDLNNGSIVCVSCGPSDTAPSGAATLGVFAKGGVHAPLSNLSDSGETVFFNSPESLAGVDTHGIENVYEWHNDTVGLISPPGQYPATFADASPDGSDVFFSTHDVLVGQDQDGGDENVYDARIDGGFPAPPIPSKQCESVAECRSEATTLSAPTVESLAAGAIGNVATTAFRPLAEFGAVKITAHSTNTLSVSAPGSGELRLTASGLTTIRKSAKKAGSYTFRLILTSSERRLLAKHKSVTLGVRVSFTPASGSASFASLKLTIKHALKPSGKARAKKKG